MIRFSRKRYALILFAAAMFLLQSANPVLAGLKKKTVEASGTGATLNLAIYEALDEAIGRINGKSIESRQQLDSVEVSQTENEKEDYYSSEAFRKSIRSATKGVVDGYEILSKGMNQELGLWEVSLSVTVMKFIVKDSNRKRIAIIPLKTGDGRFTVDGEPVSKERMGRILTQNISTTLVQSRRFTVLDREYMAETLGERNIALSPNAPVADMARLGQELVADYVMVGTLEDIGFSTKERKMSSGRKLTSKQGNVELSVRLIDTATRQIVFSAFLKIKAKDKDLSRFGASSKDDGAESALAMVAADRTGRKILDAIYPVLIVSVNGERVTLGQGGSQLKLGDRLEIFKYGEKLTDPYTKEFIGREEIKVGSLEITRVNPKQSHARLINSSVDISAEFEPKKFICRVAQDQVDTEKVERKKRRKEREDRRKKHDSDW